MTKKLTFLSEHRVGEEGPEAERGM